MFKTHFKIYCLKFFTVELKNLFRNYYRTVLLLKKFDRPVPEFLHFFAVFTIRFDRISNFYNFFVFFKIELRIRTLAKKSYILFNSN
jgi:hypothetical protein